MKALILAAGYATRLYPLTLNKPKALLDVKGKPMIEYIIEKIPEEISEILIVTNAKFYNLFDEWLKGFNSQRHLTLIDDGSTDNDNRLGGIGDLKLAVEKFGVDDYIVLASDNLFDFNLDSCFDKFKKERNDMLVVYDVKSQKEARKFGVVRLDDNGRIIEFFEKPQNPETTLVATAIYFFTKDSISLLKTYFEEGNSPEGPGFLIEWLSKRKEVYGCALEGEWIDIGSIESYERIKGNF